MDRKDLFFFYLCLTAMVLLAISPLIFGWSNLAFVSVAVPIMAAVMLLIFQRRWSGRMIDLRHSHSGSRAVAMLRAFEESGQGWFWETDAEGKIKYISDIVIERIGKDPKMVRQMRLADLIASYNVESDGETNRTLGFHMSTHTSFKDLHIKVVAENERWWSLSGSPVFDENEKFRGFRGIGSDLTDVKKSREKITRLAKFDLLTQLANRSSMNDILQHVLRGRGDMRGKCSVMLLDLDKFKQVNDTLGHLAGDELLKDVAQRLCAIIGKDGQVGRLGGDEFQIILPKMIDRDQLSALAETIIIRLSEPYLLSLGQVRIGVSIGIVVIDGETENTDIIRNADLALYAAKDAGRGTARFYAPELLAKASERTVLEEELRVALNEGQLFLVYQPVVDVATETISGFEVLTRWRHPEKGMVSPEKFIAVAEEAGLIELIGDWTLRTACAQLAQWSSEMKVAVNVSPRQFRSGNLPQTVLNAIAHNGLRPEQVELEITESVFLEGDETDVAMFEQLKRIGVRLALDDFGTGYSALGYLQKAPFDKIKIDQSFVRGATLENSINNAIISSIVTLAQALGMDTTAEGAESYDELNLVRKLGCSHVQGYIYSEPVTAEEATKLVAKPGMEIKATSKEPSRNTRRKVLHRISLHHNGVIEPATVRNISSTGAMIEAPLDLPSKTPIILAFSDNIHIKAVVRWSEGDKLGVEFTGKVDHNDLKRRTFAGHMLDTRTRDDRMSSAA
ncbi:EAL domain-containing protein [Parasphingorhabdus sp. DH2-15]|uniref:EAL domain-containing protein n=1 Tax=Parasphingorhabdus sp. DH2-15 TaxID=3444112 RepID=UPI003F6889FD